MAAPALVERGPTERLRFLDAVRGFALFLMIVNHTGRWWQDGSMGWPRYNTIYLSMAIGAPLFLFLVGFCLPLSYARRTTSGSGGATLDGAVAGKFFQRGARLILASWLLNFLVFHDEPFWEGGVLQTIGLGIIFGFPPMLLLHRRVARYLLMTLAVALYVAFSLSYHAIAAWLPAHPVIARVFFFEFPPWPWISLVWIGLALGWVWAHQETSERRARYLWLMTAAGVVGLGAFAVWDRAHGTPIHLSLAFKRDFILNNHWTARGVTNFLCFGSVFCLLGLAYYLVEVRRLPAGWLVILGRTSLMLYFLHHFIVFSLTSEWLGWKFNSWWQYWLANAVLMGVLVYIGKLWLGIRSLASRRLQPALR
ncbi:MAG TPA: heparan-alpha-glucosaminide N-acetyltransferase domain-containing protein [Candidatus Nitrosotalea sp.]|nr:heparan-alpha-glucosaminide N-acetyltransferase domain-containing protein [Candidatus Nitrosotalea sp.]